MERFTRPKISTLRGYDCNRLKNRYSELKGKTSRVNAPRALRVEIHKVGRVIQEKSCHVRIRPTRPVRPRIRTKRRMVIPTRISKPYIPRENDCPHGEMTASIRVDDSTVHTSLKDGMRREMSFVCPPDDNKCIAGQVMRFKGIVKKNRKCIKAIPTVKFSPKARRNWGKTMEGAKDEIATYKREMKAWEKEPWSMKPSKPSALLTPTQQKNIDIIKGKKPII